jgi:hypothetical protein
VTNDQADPCGIVMATLVSCVLRDRYLNEQQELQPDLQTALRQALGSRFDVQISVGAGGPKPRVVLFGMSFGQTSPFSAGAPVLGIEVKHIRKGQSPSSAIAETIGQCLIYWLLYPRVGFVLIGYGIAVALRERPARLSFQDRKGES